MVYSLVGGEVRTECNCYVIKLSEPMPHNDKHYQKLLRTYKFVVYMVLAVLFVLGVGLSLMWLFDRAGGSFMSRGWQVFFITIFALLVAGLQINN